MYTPLYEKIDRLRPFYGHDYQFHIRANPQDGVVTSPPPGPYDAYRAMVYATIFNHCIDPLDRPRKTVYHVEAVVE